jgi:hypothetical protein
MILAASSLILGTNALHAFLKHYTLYGLAFTGVLISSLVYHTSAKNDSCLPLFWLDQLMLISLFLVGFYYTLRIPLLQIIAASISIALVLLYYHYGRFTKTFCWDPVVGTVYHSSMHIIGSLGHHAILLGLP